MMSEYDRVNHSLEGARESRVLSALELPDTEVGDVSVHVVHLAYHWLSMGNHLMKIHVVPRTRGYFPHLEEGGLDISL
ncbi:MAG: hypothetical protein ACKPKO_58305, partial [Candidatus Fonsibacter sp.]